MGEGEGVGCLLEDRHQHSAQLEALLQAAASPRADTIWFLHDL